jgi:hypothetical protein
MPDVFLKRESDTELRFEHSILSAWIFAAIGCAAAYFGSRYIDPPVARWMVTGMGALFAALGVGGALWRYELTLDLVARSFRRRRGFWPSPRILQGSLSELNGVLLTRTWRRGENSESAVWVVSLDFQSWEKSVRVFETTSERKGYRRLEQLARRLQTSAIDRTGDREVSRSADELDRPVADRKPDGGAESIHEIENPPSGSGIEWTQTEIGAPMIVLPAQGFNLAAVFLALFGLPFLAFGAVALASAIGWTGVEVQGTLAAKWIVGAVFVALGLLCQAGAVFGSVAREVIRQDGEALVITLLAFGHHYRTRRLPLREIEDISIRPSKSSRSRTTRRHSGSERTEVVLRTDDVVARVAGDLRDGSQQWLCSALLTLARR